MGTYIFQNFIVMVSVGTCIRLVFDWYLYSMGTYTPEFKVLHLSCLLPLPTFLHNVQWKFKKDSEKGDKKKKSSLIRTHFEVLIIPSIIL